MIWRVPDSLLTDWGGKNLDTTVCLNKDLESLPSQTRVLKDLGDIYRCAFLEEKEGKKNCLNKVWNGSADFELCGRILWLCL